LSLDSKMQFKIVTPLLEPPVSFYLRSSYG
jgi:hypothetical protein